MLADLSDSRWIDLVASTRPSNFTSKSLALAVFCDLEDLHICLSVFGHLGTFAVNTSHKAWMFHTTNSSGVYLDLFLAGIGVFV